MIIEKILGVFLNPKGVKYVFPLGFFWTCFDFITYQPFGFKSLDAFALTLLHFIRPNFVRCLIFG